jgi:hypothetical protein
MRFIRPTLMRVELDSKAFHCSQVMTVRKLDSVSSHHAL